MTSMRVVIKGHVKKKKERNQSSNWPHLLAELLELILKRLCLRDYLRVGVVCSSWRNVVTNAIANRHCPHVPELPLVVFQSKRDFFFFNMSKQRVSNPRRIPYSSKYVCRGSFEGWLFMVNDHWLSDPSSKSIFFWNPVTASRVMLPSKLKFTNKYVINPTLLKMVASSTPHSPDCLVVVLFDDYLGCQLAFCRISDKSWTMIEAEKDTKIGIREIAILHGKLYVLTDNLMDSILVYDLQELSNPPNAKILAKLPQKPDEFPQIGWIDGERFYVSNCWFRYLATDSEFGELLLIYMFVDAVHNIQRDRRLSKCVSLPHVRAFQVYKLVITSEAQWVKVDNLGDRLLLQSFIGCKVMSTTGLVGPEELVRGNCIYFAHKFRCLSNPTSGFQVGMFSLTDKKTKYFSLNNSRGFAPSPLPFWFTPKTY